MRVRDIMTPKPITIDPETPMLDAGQRMAEERIRHLIVIEDNRVVGIVTDRDIRRHGGALERATVVVAMTENPLIVSPLTTVEEAARGKRT